MSGGAADVIIIGAGAAGLAAARELARHGFKAIVIEARDRIGGRIWTQRIAGWPRPVELGAEFIHGGNRALWSLVRHAGMEKQPVPARHWLFQSGRLRPQLDTQKRIDVVMRRIGRGFRSSAGEWLQLHASSISAADRLLMQNYVENFHGAPLSRMSARTLRAAAAAEDDAQFRLPGGYDGLISSLCDGAPSGLEIHLQSPVEWVRWKRHHVLVTAGRRRWRARAAIVTVPLGVLHAAASGLGGIRFDPPLVEKQRLWRKLESGHAFRIVFRLRDTAWQERIIPAELRAHRGRGFGFLRSFEEAFPVWWSEAPDPMLVGWTGGPPAAAMAGLAKKEIFCRALHTLSRLLRCKADALADLIVDWRTHDWTSDPFSRGAYSFSTAGYETAPAKLAASVKGTLFFAGEATADSLDLGTVHAALASGQRAAREARG